MMIEKLGGIDPIKNLQKAQKLSEIYFAMDAVKAAPDIRREKIEEVARKLQDPSYIDSILDQTADKILDSLGF